LQAVDGFKLLNLIQLNSTFSQELSGSRINRVLDATGISGTFLGGEYWVVGDPTAGVLGSTTKLASELVGFRFIDAGQSQVQAGTVADTALEHMQAVAASEQGLLYIDGEGRLVFEDRHHRIKCHSTSAATFGDGEGELPYLQFEATADDNWIYNDIRLTREGGSEQTASDATSQAAYGRRTYQKSGLLLTSDSETLSAARWLLALYKDWSMRSETLVLSGELSDGMWPYALGIQPSDRVTVVRRPPGGGAAISRDYFVEAVRYDWSPGYLRVAWQLSPASLQEWWLLGTAVLGKNTRLAY
jgi:hypothetical protein